MSKNLNNTPVPLAYVEPDTWHESTREDAPEKVYPPVSIHVHSIRKRLADSDGISAKAVIDALISEGILPDDSPAYVEAVTFSQEKGEVEQTIITISEVDNEDTD